MGALIEEMFYPECQTSCGSFAPLLLYTEPDSKVDIWVAQALAQPKCQILSHVRYNPTGRYYAINVLLDPQLTAQLS